MKNQMLIIKGAGNSGKSTTIKLAFDKFLKFSLKNKRITVHYLYLTKKEVGAVIEVGSNRVGISTRGDTPLHVQKGLSFFFSNNCNIVVCATRSKGKSLLVAQNFSLKKLGITAEEWQKVKVPLSVSASQNKKIAQNLANWLKKACR